MSKPLVPQVRAPGWAITAMAVVRRAKRGSWMRLGGVILNRFVVCE